MMNDEGLLMISLLSIRYEESRGSWGMRYEV